MTLEKIIKMEINAYRKAAANHLESDPTDDLGVARALNAKAKVLEDVLTLWDKNK